MEGTQTSETQSRWSIVVLFAKFLFHFIFMGGTARALSVLIPSLVYQLDLDYTTVGFFITLNVGVLCFACPIGNYLARKFGSQLVAMVGSFFAGVSLVVPFLSLSGASVGCSFFFLGLCTSPLRQVTSETLHQHFRERYGMAETITQMGNHFGEFLLPYLTVLSLDAYGLKGALLILSACVFHGMPIGATMRPPSSIMLDKSHVLHDGVGNHGNDNKEKSGKLQERDIPADTVNEPAITDKSLFSDFDSESIALIEQQDDSQRCSSRTKKGFHKSNNAQDIFQLIRSFISSAINDSFLKNERVLMFIFLPCQLLFDVGYGSWAFFLVAYGVSLGMPESRAVYLVMLGTVGGAIGRLILISVLYKFPHLALHLTAMNVAIGSIAMFLHTFNSSLPYLAICAMMAGFGFHSGLSCAYGSIPLIVQRDNVSRAISYSLSVSGLSILISGFWTGFMFDMLGSYLAIFRILGGLLAISSLVLTLYIYTAHRITKRRNEGS